MTEIESSPRYAMAYGKAMYQIRQDARLVGLNKTRNKLAHVAAMRALGEEIGNPLVTHTDPGFQSLCDEILILACKAAAS
jgi:hypothetical protein